MQEIFKRIQWIQTDLANGRDGVVLYKKLFFTEKAVERAEVYATCCGVMHATLNNARVTFPMAPGMDGYPFRMPYVKRDVTDLLSRENEIQIYVARGWYGWYRTEKMLDESQKRSCKFALFLTYKDGSRECVSTDDDGWKVCLGNCLESDIYNGELYDAGKCAGEEKDVAYVRLDVDDALIEHDEQEVCEHERLSPVCAFTTPKGEYVIDFGQEITGYVELSLTARAGEVVEISHAEVLDKEGNFYTENYRKAKAKLTYVCKEGEQRYKPLLTFYGFRYIRLDKRPKGMDEKNVTAIVVHSKLERTGYIRTSNQTLNKFCENVIWGQRDNFLEIPTDCPQRDERLGWTGDTQVFCRAANYNFDCENFYARWLKMLGYEQKTYGFTPYMVPDVYGNRGFCAGWSDAAAIVPWEVYRAYGNKKLLAENYPSMKRHVDAITKNTTTEFLWTGGDQLGDWLALDASPGSFEGSSNKDFIASAFYAYSTALTVRAGKELGEDTSYYEELYENIRKKFIQTYPFPKTQTECVLALAFGLTDEKERVADDLARAIIDCGRHLQTGFLGTPYLLHALSENGYAELAYELLLREEFPSWLYPVKCGATTVWEHWDSKNQDGELWSSDMNSFNHYAYGAVADWIYGVAAGISPIEAGYAKIKIQPIATEKLDWLEVKLQTRHGLVQVKWSHTAEGIVYEITTPADTLIIIEGREYNLPKGEYKIESSDRKVIEHTESESARSAATA